jgi:hypothetical protein
MWLFCLRNKMTFVVCLYRNVLFDLLEVEKEKALKLGTLY